MIKCRVLYLLLFIFFFSLSVFPQIVINGEVSNENKEPLISVNVSLLLQRDSSLVVGAATDSLGKYKLQIPFSISGNDEELLIRYSLVGYESHYLKLHVNEYINKAFNVTLRNIGVNLREVTVLAPKEKFKMTSEGLVADLGHSDLKNEPEPIDVLSRFPGVIRRGDHIEILGKGTPLYYINDKKVQSFSEVERLLVKDIKSVTLVTNPGARYDSEGRAVVLIKTKRIREGIMVQTNLNGTQSDKFSHNESLSLHHKSEKINMFSSYKYSDSRGNERNDNQETMVADTMWTFSGINETLNKSQSHSYQAGFDYDITKRQLIGIKYDGTYSTPKSSSTASIFMKADSKPYIDVFSNSRSDAVNSNNHLNLYYNGKWNEQWQLNLYGDYVNRNNRSTNTSNEYDSELGEKQVLSNIKSNWNVYALNASLKYSSGKVGVFYLGVNSSWVKGYSEVIHVNSLTNGKYENRELKSALYFMYGYYKKSFSLDAGIRYENLYSVSENLLQSYKISNRRQNWLPSINGTYQTDKITHALSYAYHIERPSYNSMNDNVYYKDRFGYTKGNSKLKPSSVNDFEYKLYYKYLYFSLSYMYKTNHVMSVYYSDPANSSVVVSTEENYKKYNELKGVLFYSRPLGWWEPTFSLVCLKSFFRYNTIYGMRKSKRPIFMAYLDNRFRLPKDFIFSFDMNWQSAGDNGMINASSTFIMNARLQKNFLKNNLQLSLNVYDLFNGDHLKGKLTINNYLLNSYQKRDSRKVGISIIYRFNHYTKKYRGESAAEEEINRLGAN